MSKCTEEVFFEEILKDAMRYRFLRNHANPDDGHPYISCHKVNDWGKWYNTYECGKGADAEIDALLPDFE